MFKSYKIEGLVIKRLNFGEADKIITLLTQYHGKIVAIARGIRKISSRKAPHLELFNQVNVFLYTGRNLDIITEAQIIRSYPFLSAKIERIAQSYRIVEIIDRLCPEKEPHEFVYKTLLKSFEVLNDMNFNKYSQYIENMILIILWDLGYLPKGKKLEGDPLDNFLENIMEKSLKSKSLLTKISRER